MEKKYVAASERLGTERPTVKGTLNTRATKLANALNEQHTNPRCRVIPLGDDEEEFCLYGTTGHATDPRTQQQVVLVRANLRHCGARETEFATSDDGVTWVVLVFGGDIDQFKELLVQSWIEA